MRENTNLENFNTTRPLQLYPTGYDNTKIDAYYLSSFDRMELWLNPRKLYPLPELVFSIEALPKIFTKHDFLMVKQSLGHLYHKRIIEKMQEICPNDFQALPVKLINNEKSKEAFENHDYYMLNILHKIDALDMERSVIKYWKFSDGTPTSTVKIARFKDDKWGSHLIAREKNISNILWHPTLAKEFVKHKTIKFLADDEIE